MNVYISDKFRILSLILMIMVVFIHTTYLEGKQWPLNSFLQSFIGGGICRIAVPLFFMMSGYLFFLKVENGILSIFKKIKKRIRSLLIPYLFWNVFFILVYLLLFYLPSVSSFVNSTPINVIFQQTFLENLNLLFWSPIAFQLWFLKDLIIIVFCSPILFYLLEKTSWVIVIAFFLLLCLTQIPFMGGFFYFSLGGLLALKKIDLMLRIPIMLRSSLGIISLIIFLISSLTFSLNCKLGEWMNNGTILLGVFGLWILYDYFSKGKLVSHTGIWKYTCGYSFFIYCFHEPTLNILKKLPPFIIGQSQLVYLIFYLLVPFFMVGLSVFVARLLQKYMPSVYKVVTGGR